MLSIEKKIAPLIQRQFPDFYQEEGELFIAFVKAYYEWLENYTQLLNLENATGFDVGDTVTQLDTQGTIISKTGNSILVEVNNFAVFRCNINCDTLNPLVSSSGATSFIQSNEDFSPLFWARHLPEIRDIDNTLDRFILQFKNKYLPNIQFVTASNKELFIKNSLDFYRAKGTERAVDLFFKLIHGFEAKVYYPGDDLFRPSDNEWVNVTYLEIEPADTNVNMVGQVVYGTLSNASAFAERLVRVKKEGRFINVLYLSNLNGDFQTGENVYTKDLENNVTAKMFGSLTTFEILVSDDGFEVGEDLFVENGLGKRGRGRVREVQTFIGTVDFELLEGGWGYTSDAEVIGSDRVLTINNVTNENTEYYQLNTPFQQFETVRQDLLKIVIPDNTIDEDTVVQAYANNDVLVANGTVLFANSTEIIIESSDANTSLLTDVEYVDANSAIINATSSEDATAFGTVIGVNPQSTITYTSTGGLRLNNGDLLYQKVAINNVVRRVANGVVDRAFLEFDPVERSYVNFIADIGTFRTDLPFYRDSDDAEFNIVSISNTNIGIVNPPVARTFYAGGTVYGESSGVSADIAGNFSFEEEASFVVTEFEESYTIPDFKNIEFIDAANLDLVIDTAAYGISSNVSDPTKGFNDTISDVTEFTNVTIGSIKTIIETSPGSGYPIDPFFIINEPVVSCLERFDFQIHYRDRNQSFAIGEIIEGQTTGARARVFFHDPNNRILRATRVEIADDLTTNKDFIPGEIFRGEDTNISSTIDDVFELRRKPRTGLNADIKSEAFSGPGFVTQLDVIDSGFGYEDGERLVLRSYRDPTKEVSVTARLGKQGIGQGYHLNRKSFLSSDKYIQDSDFYQEYSYEVLTSLPFETYRDTLIKVLHVAGTKPFGSYVSTTETPIEITLESSTEGFDIRKDTVFINENVFYQHTANTA